jgi:hypothetical protein
LKCRAAAVIAAVAMSGTVLAQAPAGGGVVQAGDASLRAMGLSGGRLIPVSVVTAGNDKRATTSITIQMEVTRQGVSRVATFAMDPFPLRAPGFAMLVSDEAGQLREMPAPAPSSFQGTDNATGDEIWATVVDGRVRGVVFAAGGGEAIAYIQPVADFPAAGIEGMTHVVYGPGDVIGGVHECGVDDEVPSMSSGAGFGPRGPGCKYVELVAEADYPYYQASGNSAAATVQDIETVMLGVNALYRNTASFSSPCRFALKAVTVWATAGADPYNALPLVEASPDTMLNIQSARWAAIASPVHDVVHLFTGRDLSGATVGYASVGAMCQTNFSDSLVQSRFTSVLAARYADSAHELGHNFGMQHDSAAGFIMSAVINSGSPPTAFSSASVTAYNNNIANYTCLNNTWTDALPDWAQTLPGSPVLIDVLGNDGQGVICTAAVSSFTLAGSTTDTPGATISVSVGTGPGGRNQVLYTPPVGAVGIEDRFFYTAGGVSTPVYVTVVSPRQPDQPYQSVVAGISAKYYDISSNGGTSVTLYPTMQDLTTYPQFGTGTPAQINFAPSTSSAAGSGRGFAVGAIFDGYIQVPQTAFYTFWLSSDDLSRLFFGSTLVVDNRSLTSTGEASGVIALAPGRHKIHLDYAQYAGNSTLVMSYAYGAQARITVPASALWRATGVCHADYNSVGGVSVQDIFDFLNDWFAGLPRADFNGVNGLTVQDVFDFLNTWFGPC